MTALPMAPTWAGSLPKTRSAMMPDMSAGATSTTGAMSMLMPTEESSRAVTSPKWRASSSPCMWGLPGNSVKGARRRATGPPSWSTAISRGGWPQRAAKAWQSAHSRRTWSGVSMLILKRISPPTCRSAMSVRRSSLNSRPSKPTIRRWPASCSSVKRLICMRAVSSFMACRRYGLRRRSWNSRTARLWSSQLVENWWVRSRRDTKKR